MVYSLEITDPRFPTDDWHIRQRSVADSGFPAPSLLSSEMSELKQTNHAATPMPSERAHVRACMTNARVVRMQARKHVV